MMVFSPINEEQYDLAAGTIIYGKLFPKILEDFLCREDAKMMMKASNLPVSTTVNTLVNTVLAGTAGPVPLSGTGVGKGTGAGTGQTSPAYDGGVPSPGAKILEQRRRLEKELGVTLTEGLVSGIEKIAGE